MTASRRRIGVPAVLGELLRGVPAAGARDLPVVGDLYRWTSERIDRECKRAWREYDAHKTARYTEHFREDPHRHPLQAWSAKNFACALPPGWEELAQRLPRARHRHHLSGKSSQTLALALLGASASLAPAHTWLLEAFGLPVPDEPKPPTATFEVELDKEVLGEASGQRTSVDYLVKSTKPRMVLCIECKWCEAGVGACSCADSDGCDPTTGACRPVVRDQRPVYWQTAADLFGLPARTDGEPCPLSPVYQAVRNVAAALALRPKDGLAVFGLVYDSENPYFAGCGDWSGWPAVLHDTLDGADPNLRFCAVSWQQLMPHLVLDVATRDWTRDKHGLS